MASARISPVLSSLFPYEKWSTKLPALAKRYDENQPFPHLHLANFLEEEVALAMAREFPGPSTDAWIYYKHQNENKRGLPQRSLFPPLIGAVADELNSPEFVAWLSELTGIPGLLSDSMLEGGGLHQSGRGGFLNVHTDFSIHHFQKHWQRRVNLILYLNPDWREEWGGALEFWDRGMQECVRKYSPFCNDAVIFTTDERALHGFPDPLSCPESISRKSLALYYYTEARDSKVTVRSTNYHSRPSDGLLKSSLIWLDKQAVDLYSRAKMSFGFSDQWMSRVLRSLARKK